jgi:hypothetical protein
MRRIMVTLSLLLVAAGEAATAALWQRLLAEPTRAHLAPIAAAIGACGPEPVCRAKLAPNEEESDRLVRAVANGDAVVVEAGFLASTVMHFSGGDYEDLVRALGGVSEREPELFLRLVTRYGKNDDLLHFLPQDTIDRPDLQLEVVRRRRAKLAKVSAPDLEDARRWALALLARAEESLREPAAEPR